MVTARQRAVIIATAPSRDSYRAVTKVF